MKRVLRSVDRLTYHGRRLVEKDWGLMVNDSWAMNDDRRLMIHDGGTMDDERWPMYHDVWPMIHLGRRVINYWWSFDKYCVFLFCSLVVRGFRNLSFLRTGLLLLLTFLQVFREFSKYCTDFL